MQSFNNSSQILRDKQKKKTLVVRKEGFYFQKYFCTKNVNVSNFIYIFVIEKFYNKCVQIYYFF